MDAPDVGDPFQQFWHDWLKSTSAPPTPASAPVVRVADLFSGCGGLSVGVREACRALGLSEQVELAVDTNDAASSVFQDNFEPERVHRGALEELVDGSLSEPLTPSEKALSMRLEGLDLAVGGPPCQGHSDLNNHTRRQDPKNALYARMARFIEVTRPKNAIIENVPGVVHDRNNVVDCAVQALTRAGYTVSHQVLAADELGWAQRRRRHVLLASLEHDDLDASSIHDRYRQPALPVVWAIAGAGLNESTFDSPSRHSSVNERRIRYLFDHDLFDLPDSERPDCHRLKPHSYKAVYGRMKPTDPAPTITSGFGSTGQGRFVHPYEPRTITPHEAARLQGFPDWFHFRSEIGRRALQEMIGNAVPSRLGYVAALELLR